MKVALLQHANDPAYIGKLQRLGDYEVTSPHLADLILGVSHRGRYKSTPVVQDIEFAYRMFARLETNMPVFIGVTGTNGKTTVTKLLATLLDCPAAGNVVGSELLLLVPENEAQVRALPEHIVVEIASAQCSSIRDFHPQISVITNIRADHLDFHGDEDSYARAKAKIFVNQTEDDLLIYNANDEITRSLLPECRARKTAFDVESAPPSDIEKIKQHSTLPGRFNLENVLACVIAARHLGLDDDTIYERLSRFKGVPQRMELIAKIEGVPIISNSVSTNPDSTMHALAALGGKGLLIMGGIYKEYLPIDELLESIKAHCSGVILYGRSADNLRRRLSAVGYNSVNLVQDFRTAIATGIELGRGSNFVLFSPSCLAYDMFKTTVERGERFSEIVRQIV